MAVLVYLVRLSIIGVVGESVTPSGPVHTVLTRTGTFTDGLNSTVQVRVTSDPTGRMGLTRLLVAVTKVVAGTVWIIVQISLEDVHFYDKLCMTHEC